MEGNHVRRVERLRKHDDSNDVMTQHPPIWFPLSSLFFYEYNYKYLRISINWFSFEKKYSDLKEDSYTLNRNACNLFYRI